MVSANKVNQYGHAKLYDVTQLSWNIIGERTVSKKQVKQGIKYDNDYQPSYPFVSFTIVQVHGLF